MLSNSFTVHMYGSTFASALPFSWLGEMPDFFCSSAKRFFTIFTFSLNHSEFREKANHKITLQNKDVLNISNKASKEIPSIKLFDNG